MSAAPERREPIDIEEFERRLRSPEPARRVEDPLAELARLLGQQQAQDPVAELFADRGAGRSRRSQAGAAVASPVAPPIARISFRPVFRLSGPDPFAVPMLRPQSARPVDLPGFSAAPPPVHAEPEPMAAPVRAI